MSSIATRLALAVVMLLALAAWLIVPPAIEGVAVLAAQDDPVRLTDLTLDKSFDAGVAAREIDAALASNDAELAESFLALADERGVPVDASLRERVAASNGAAASTGRAASHFAYGFLTGEPEDMAGLAGTVTGDLFVFGDIRDVVRETSRAARGEAVDELILGLACVGLAVTAGTYASLGAAAPARVGVSVLKAAGKAGRLSARLTATLVRPLRGMIDATALRIALGPGALLHPALAARRVRAAVKMEKAQGLMTFAGDVGRLQARAGTRAALDGLRLAEAPKDVTRLARLAAAKGNKTRAVLKLLGRGAIVLSIGLMQIASLSFWAMFYLLGICAALKRLTERTTLRWIAHRKHARLRRRARNAHQLAALAEKVDPAPIRPAGQRTVWAPGLSPADVLAANPDHASEHRGKKTPRLALAAAPG